MADPVQFIEVTTSRRLRAAAPLDDKYLVADALGLAAMQASSEKYEGMIVFQQDTKETWQLRNDVFVEFGGEGGGSSLSNIFDDTGNSLLVGNSAKAGDVSITAQGLDSDISIILNPKGNLGNVLSKVTGSSNNDVLNVSVFLRETSDVLNGSDGIGSSIEISTQDDAGLIVGIDIIHRLSNSQTGNKSSNFIVQGWGSNSFSDFINIQGSGGNDPNTGSVSLGFESISNGSNGVAIGPGAKAQANKNISLGFRAGSATGTPSGDSISIGSDTNQSVGQNIGESSTAVGPQAKTSGFRSSAFGFFANSSGSESIAVGPSIASGANSISVGNSADATETGTIAIGKSAQATAENVVVYGSDANGSGAGSVVMGKLSVSDSVNGVAIGFGAEVKANNGVAIGTDAADTANASVGDNFVAIGNNVNSGGLAIGINSLAIGTSSLSPGSNSTAFGASSRSDGPNSVAIGNAAWSTSTDGIAIGNNTKSSAIKAVVIGSGFENTLANSISLAPNGVEGVLISESSGSITINLNGDINVTGGIGLHGVTAPSQASHVADASTSHGVSGSGDDATINSALDDLGVKINSLIAIHENNGGMATS